MRNHYYNNDLSKKQEILSEVNIDISHGETKNLPTIRGLLFLAGVWGDNRCSCLYIIIPSWNGNIRNVNTLHEYNCSMKFFQSKNNTLTIGATGTNNCSEGISIFKIKQII